YRRHRQLRRLMDEINTYIKLLNESVTVGFAERIERGIACAQIYTAGHQVRVVGPVNKVDQPLRCGSLYTERRAKLPYSDLAEIGVQSIHIGHVFGIEIHTRVVHHD